MVALSIWYLEVVDGYVVTEPDSPEWQRVEAERRAMVEHALEPARAAHPDVTVEVQVRRGPSLSTLRDAAAEADVLLDIIAQRVALRRTGARWQRAVLERLEAHMPRQDALAAMMERYLELSEEGLPVHTWPVDR